MNIIKKTIQSFYSRDGFAPVLLVFHTSDGNYNATWETIKNPANERSYNYLICENGEVQECVAPEQSAWANGLTFNPTADLIKKLPEKVNANKITISIAFIGHHTSQDANLLQYESAMNLAKKLCKDWKILADREHFLGHYEIRSDKQCPAKISVDRILFETKISMEMENRQITVKLGLIQRLIELYKQLIAKLISSASNANLGQNSGSICGGGKD